LPDPAPRKLVHTRQVSYLGFQRVDGLWDIEARLLDTKPEAFEDGVRSWQANEPVHQMVLRLTIDGDLVVRDIAVDMEVFPHAPCPQAMDPMRGLVGARLTRGWRKAINERLGGIQGCAHLRELLVNAATAAYQSLPVGVTDPNAPHPPHHYGQCVAWDLSGPVVERHFPMFFRPRAAAQADAEPQST
jgi:Protein of unknown function (DUF2889)